MRNLRHDYRRKNGSWSGEHGEVVWIPRSAGDLLVTVCDYPILKSEALVLARGIVEAERERYARWRMGDPPLPEPFSTFLQDIDVLTVEQTFAYARDIDADADVYDAAMNARHGRR